MDETGHNKGSGVVLCEGQLSLFSGSKMMGLANFFLTVLACPFASPGTTTVEPILLPQLLPIPALRLGTSIGWGQMGTWGVGVGTVHTYAPMRCPAHSGCWRKACWVWGCGLIYRNPRWVG